jgi:FHS family L-fucose permease-like MFS transporter
MPDNRRAASAFASVTALSFAWGFVTSLVDPLVAAVKSIFSLTNVEATSGILCAAIVGGAFLPLLAGAISDAHGYVASFVVPMLCYTLLCGFAVAAGRAGTVRDEGEAPAVALH